MAQKGLGSGLAPARGVELGRLVLLDEVEGNGESWFLESGFLTRGAACRAAWPKISTGRGSATCLVIGREPGEGYLFVNGCGGCDAVRSSRDGR